MGKYMEANLLAPSLPRTFTNFSFNGPILALDKSIGLSHSVLDSCQAVKLA